MRLDCIIILTIIGLVDECICNIHKNDHYELLCYSYLILSKAIKLFGKCLFNNFSHVLKINLK